MKESQKITKEPLEEGVKTSIITRKIRLFIGVPSDNKDEIIRLYKRLYSWQDLVFKASNLVASHLYIQEQAKELLYSIACFKQMEKEILELKDPTEIHTYVDEKLFAFFLSLLSFIDFCDPAFRMGLLSRSHKRKIEINELTEDMLMDLINKITKNSFSTYKLRGNPENVIHYLKVVVKNFASTVSEATGSAVFGCA